MKSLYDIYSKSGSYVWSVISESEGEALFSAICCGCENIYEARFVRVVVEG